MEQMAEEIEERDAWRKALGRATGRDYSRSTRRMTIDQYAQAGSK